MHTCGSYHCKTYKSAVGVNENELVWMHTFRYYVARKKKRPGERAPWGGEATRGLHLNARGEQRERSGKQRLEATRNSLQSINMNSHELTWISMNLHEFI